MNQIAVVNQGGKASAERVIVLPGEEFDALIGRPSYHLCESPSHPEAMIRWFAFVFISKKEAGWELGSILLRPNHTDHAN